MSQPLVSSVLAFYGTVGVPLVYAANLYLISLANTFEINIIIRLAGIVSAFVGLLLWIVSYIHLNRAFGVLPRHQAAVTTGLYHWMKHPMYVGILMTFFGLSFANQSRAGLLFTLLVMTPMLYVRARIEEKRLIE